jgi:peptide-methionine (S)-S-oxide reductase
MTLHRSVIVAALLTTALVASTAPSVRAADKPAPNAAPTGLARAIFAGGCFWCEETAFEGVKGVVSVVSGYTGGHTRNPTYEEVGSGVTGHAESVEVSYDPARISYEKLLDIFWHNVDPTQANGQFCDHGTQYRSAIFTIGATQMKLALASKARLEATGRFKAPIVTQIVPASTFYPAEEYHQDFYKKNPVRYHAYRLGCGRDRRLAEIWGKDAQTPGSH